VVVADVLVSALRVPLVDGVPVCTAAPQQVVVTFASGKLADIVLPNIIASALAVLLLRCVLLLG
jgi:hypothetical protein